MLDVSGMDPTRAARLRAKLQAALAMLDTNARNSASSEISGRPARRR